MGGGKDDWTGTLAIAMMIIAIVVFVISRENAKESWEKSKQGVYFNNKLFEIQSRNNTALLINFRSKKLRGKRNAFYYFKNYTVTDKFPEFDFEVVSNSTLSILFEVSYN